MRSWIENEIDLYGGLGIGNVNYTTEELYLFKSFPFNITNVVAGFNATEEIDPFYFYQVETIVVCLLLLILIVFANTAVLLSLQFGKRRKSRMNFFIKQLAIADLLVGLILIPTDVVQKVTIVWYAGDLACKIIKFLNVFVTYGSNYVLVALSIDRYDAITRPMNFSRSWCRARALVFSAWSLSLIFSFPVLFLPEETIVESQLQCWIELTPRGWCIYITAVSVTLFFAPALIITWCYAVIVATIWSQSKQDPTRDSRRASSRGLIPRAKIKTIKMTLVIVFVFVLCWSPYIVFDLLQVYGYIPKTQTTTAVATFVQSLAPLNSAANPIIYCLFSTEFCKTVKNFQPLSWIANLCPESHRDCFGAGNRANSSRTTVTTSLTASSRKSPHSTILNQASSRKRVMVSIV